MKKLSKAMSKPLLVSVCLCILSACNTNSVKEDANTAVKLDLKSTTEYIPVLSASKEGLPLPFEIKENPYAKQKGRIKKESILSFIEAKRAINSNDFDKAENLLNSLTQSQVKLSGPWVLLGDIAIERNELDIASSHYQKALAINNENVNAYLRLALTQRQQGKFIAAQNTYAWALSVWPDFPEAHLNIAILYDIYLNHPIRAQRHMEAYVFLTKAEDAQASQWLSDIQSRTGMSTTLPIESEEIALYEQEEE